MVKDKQKKLILLAVAAGLIIAAAVWSALISGGSELESMTRRINAHGYSLRYDDWYPAFHSENISIADSLPDLPLGAAVAASTAGGYRSDVQTRGDVVLFLARVDEESVITVFTLDGELELCFIQHPGTGEVRALGMP